MSSRCAGLDSVRYDVVAKVPVKTSDEEPRRERLKEMMQSLLAGRFNLAFHRETKELTTYVLAVDKKGFKIPLREAGNDMGRNTFNMPAAAVWSGQESQRACWRECYRSSPIDLSKG